MHQSKRAKQDIDKFLGESIRNLRTNRRKTQKEIASVLHISYQQLQKFEYGLNKLSASDLLRLADHFRVPLDYFLPEEERKHLPLVSSETSLLEIADRLSSIAVYIECCIKELQKLYQNPDKTV